MILVFLVQLWILFCRYLVVYLSLAFEICARCKGSWSVLMYFIHVHYNYYDCCDRQLFCSLLLGLVRWLNGHWASTGTTVESSRNIHVVKLLYLSYYNSGLTINFFFKVPADKLSRKSLAPHKLFFLLLKCICTLFGDSY